MQDAFFYLFSALTLICGFLVVANPISRNPVTSALFLVLTIISLAGLFVLLRAFFLAAVQILIYAGAVMVLFLFVIMLLNLKDEEQRKIKRTSVILGGIGGGALACLLVGTLAANFSPGQPNLLMVEGSTMALGKILFTEYLLPFEIVSVLLLVAMVGVVLLSKKELK